MKTALEELASRGVRWPVEVASALPFTARDGRVVARAPRAAAALTVGIDHSLTACGVVAVPASWELDFRRVMRVTLETRPTLPIPVRRAAIAADIVAFVRTAVAHYRVPLSSVRVAIEGGIAMRGKLSSIRSQERLAAIIEDRLFADLRLELEIAPQSSARRLFLGPELAGKSGSGATVQALLDRVIPDHATWFEAELDAFLVANFLLAEAGEAFVSVAEEA